MYAIETNEKRDEIKRHWCDVSILEFNTSLTDGKPHYHAPLTSLEILPLCQIRIGSTENIFQRMMCP